MSKYYTATYEDLIYRMEAEIKTGKEWKKWDFNSESEFLDFTNLILIAKNITHGDVRIKYLDQNDIEECGWKQIGEPYRYFCEKEGDAYTMLYNGSGMCRLNYETKSKDYELTLFKGKIKNKAELKRVMNQVGIK